MKDDLISEREARRIGVSAHDIAKLRAILKAGIRNGSLTVATENSGAASINLRGDQMEPVIAFLMEREAQFLGSFGVVVEETENAPVVPNNDRP